MKRLKEKKPVIDCNNGWSRAALRLLVLLIPYWLLFCPGYLIYAIGDDNANWYVENWFGIPLVLLTPLSLLLGALSTYLCLSNKIAIQKGQISLPPPRFGRYPIESLVEVSLQRRKNGSVKSVILSLELPQSNSKDNDKTEKHSFYESISIGRLKGNKGKDLLQLLERSCPDCRIDNEVRSFLSGNQEAKAVQTDQSLDIHYHSHERIKNFLTLIKSYEGYFWKVYLSVCALPIIVLAPVPFWLVPSFINRFFGQPQAAPPAWMNDWFNFFGKICGHTVSTVQDPTRLYFELITKPPVVMALLICSLFILFRFIRFLMQPNRLIVNEEGYCLQHTIKGRTLSRKNYQWSSFERVTLQKPRGATSAEQWLVAFHSSDGKAPKTLRFSAIKGDHDRMMFLNAIERWAPHLNRDPELVEMYRPAQKQSYTELWLQSLTTPPKRERLAPLLAGQVLRSGSYVIERQIGTGGQGVAYLAKTQSGESIVIKEFVLPVFVDKAARRQALEKFEAEAVLLQGLGHPRIVQLLDFFIEDHRGYLALEHINGRSLRRMIEEDGPMSEQTVIRLAEQMCDILEYLHSLQPPLVHRDFTPDNLILNEQGILKLIDFNVAHQKESRTAATVVGKHAYLPPEQFRGRPIPQSDIYAMGASLYFLLTGQDPEPVSVSNPILAREDVSPALDALVAKATELDTAKRFACASDVLLALNEISSTNEVDDDFVTINLSANKVICEE